MYDFGICKHDASVDGCTCPRFQSELGLTLCGHLALTWCVAHSSFASLAALLLPWCYRLAASSAEMQEVTLQSFHILRPHRHPGMCEGCWHHWMPEASEAPGLLSRASSTAIARS